MSLDIWGTVDTGGPEPMTVWDFNITHNLSRMWQWAGCYEALYESDGKQESAILPALKEAHAKLLRYPDEARALRAKNGWGTYYQAVPWLERLISAIEKHPLAVIRVSR